MTNRREFLQIGISATAWPIAASAARASALDSKAPPPLLLYKSVYDTRFAPSAQFGRKAGDLGIAVHAITGDMTSFWYNELYHVWRDTPAPIAGLTAHGPMFCFEQLARDYGMRIVFRAEHRLEDSGELRHDMTGPAPMMADMNRLVGAGSSWGGRMAEIVAACPTGRTPLESCTVRGAGPARGSMPEDKTLYSWVVAPVPKGTV